MNCCAQSCGAGSSLRRASSYSWRAATILASAPAAGRRSITEPACLRARLCRFRRLLQSRDRKGVGFGSPIRLNFCGIAALCGRQSCLQAAFQAGVEQATHAIRADFFRAAKPEKLAACRKRRPERPPAGRIACHTKVVMWGKMASCGRLVIGLCKFLESADD